MGIFEDQKEKDFIGSLKIDLNILSVLKETDRTGNICLGDSILRQRQNKGHVVYVWLSETVRPERERLHGIGGTQVLLFPAFSRAKEKRT